MSASVVGACAYLGARLGGEDYTEATSTKQSQALNSAVDTLARYAASMNARDHDAAIYEQALWLLGSRAAMQAQGVTSYSLSGISESYSTAGRPADVAPNAWKIIKYGLDGKGGAERRKPIWLL